MSKVDELDKKLEGLLPTGSKLIYPSRDVSYIIAVIDELSKADNEGAKILLNHINWSINMIRAEIMRWQAAGEVKRDKRDHL